jgi:uncharacterized protein
MYTGDAILDGWERKTNDKQKGFKQYLNRANKNTVLRALPMLHDEAFEKIDCLTCANCCKNYSPRFKAPDIKRISKYLGMKEPEFKQKYLKEDSDGDHVNKQMPCPFLATNNTCDIYDVRPRDCERFPYTDEDVLYKQPALTLKNSTFCPAVYHVMVRLENDFK